MNRTCFAFLLVFTLGGPALERGWAAEFAGAMATADQLLRDGHFDRAATSYAALPADRLPLEAIYNHGIALYRSGNLGEAAGRFRRAAASTDQSLAARARYNLGNTHFAQAVERLQSGEQGDPNLVIADLITAIESYRSALRLDPGDDDSRANIESANKLIQQLQQQQQQQEQQQQEQNQNQQPQDGDESRDEQPQEKQESEQRQDDQQRQQGDQQQQSEQQQDDQPQQDSQQQQRGAQQQQAEQQQTEQQQAEQQQAEQQRDEQQRDESQQQSDQPQPSEQQSPSDRQQQQQPSEQQPSQQQPTSSEPSDSSEPPEQTPEGDDPPGETPTGELTAENAESQSDPSATVERIAADESAEMTEEEARKMLQAIRDRDLLRRLRRQAIERSRRVPVDRDW